MEASNNTTTDTQYRTAGGNPRMDEKPGSSWVLIKAGEKATVPDPPCPFKLEFKVNGRIVYSRVCDKPLDRVLLIQAAGKNYQVRRYKRTAKQPAKFLKSPKPPQPTRPSSPQGGYGPGPASRA